jgi:hypothetical protein
MKCFRLRMILIYILIGYFVIYFVFIICRPIAKVGDTEKTLDFEFNI